MVRTHNTNYWILHPGQKHPNNIKHILVDTIPMTKTTGCAIVGVITA
jgi:hypothetical protein